MTSALASPKDVRSSTTGTTPASALSIWLYQVRRNPDLLNDPPRRISPDEVLAPGLPVDLYCLLTPIFTSTEGEQALLGLVLQTLSDNAIIGGSLLAAPLDPARVQLRVTLEALTLEELTRVWLNLDAFTRRIQLSVDFPMPRPAGRERIWHRSLPPSAPLASDVDLRLLAQRIEVSGAVISGAALAAAFAAAEEGTSISLAHLVRALAAELEKLGRPPTVGEFRELHPILRVDRDRRSGRGA